MIYEIAIVVFVFLVVGVAQWIEWRTLPGCAWCGTRHRGRCIWNPRAGRFWSNANDGYFDINDPNR